MRLSAAGVQFLGEEKQEEGPARKKRRTREEGVGGGQDFKDWGSRKMILIAVVHKVQENYHNLQTLLEAIQINSFPCKLTGDFAFIMPIVGLC